MEFKTLFLVVLLFLSCASVNAITINPSVESQPFFCRYSITEWTPLCVSGGKGTQGPQGEPGTGNITIYSFYNSSNFTTISNFTTYTLLNITYSEMNQTPNMTAGPQGPQGIQGIQGLQGVNGTEGMPGINGTPGDPGPQGEKGDKGDTGATGPKGDTGAQGPAGADGAANMTAGPQGIQGVNGTPGLPGPQGEQGPQGVNGTPGIDGYTPVFGVDYFNGSTGPQGPQGIQGIQGEVGPMNMTANMTMNMTMNLTTNTNTIDFHVKEGGVGNLYKGQAVYISGSDGSLAKVLVADNTVLAKTRVVGLVTDDLTTNAAGYVRRNGELTGVDTRSTNTAVNPLGQTWSAGDLLFLTTGGGMTNVRPTSGRSVKVAYTIKGSSASDILLAYPMENPVWITDAIGEDIVLRLGDNAGANKVSIRNYSNSEVVSFNSLGQLTYNGSSSTTANRTSGGSSILNYSIGSGFSGVYPTFLMHMNGTDSGTSFPEELGKTMTRYNTVTKTGTKYLGSASAYFDGTGDYIDTPNSADFDIVGGDFTISGWIYTPNTGLTKRVLCYGSTTPGWSSSTGWNWLLQLDTSNKLNFVYQKSGNAANDVGLSATAVPFNTWTHFAIIKSGTNIQYYMNGISNLSYTYTNAVVLPSGTKYFDIGSGVGESAGGSVGYNGYIDELTIWKGSAISISSLYPQTTELLSVTYINSNQITHGYGTTPSYAITTAGAAGTIATVSNIGATTFTVNLTKYDGSFAQNQTVYWMVGT